MGTNDKNEKMR